MIAAKKAHPTTIPTIPVTENLLDFFVVSEGFALPSPPPSAPPLSLRCPISRNYWRQLACH